MRRLGRDISILDRSDAVAEQQFIGPRSTSVLRAVLVVVGAAGLVLGVGFWVNGLTVAGGFVTVPVSVAEGPGSAVGAAEPQQVDVAVDALPDSVRVWAPASSLQMTAWGSTVAEQALARAPQLLAGVGVALAAWLLVPVLGSISGGRPFRQGSGARVAGVALVVLVAGWLGPMLAGLATLQVVARLGLEEPVTWGMTFSLAPLLVAGLVLVVAEAFRRGEQISRDVEGLV
jgi:hypothetical protein